MERKTSITKVMAYLSSAFLIFLLIGFILIPNKMSNTKNYCFSDKTELMFFEQKLEDENISFTRLSDTTVNIKKIMKRKQILFSNW